MSDCMLLQWINKHSGCGGSLQTRVDIGFHVNVAIVARTRTHALLFLSVNESLTISHVGPCLSLKHNAAMPQI